MCNYTRIVKIQTIQMVIVFNVEYKNVYCNGHYLSCKHLLQQFIFLLRNISLCFLVVVYIVEDECNAESPKYVEGS